MTENWKWLWLAANPMCSCLKKWSLLHAFEDIDHLKSASKADLQECGLVSTAQIDSLTGTQIENELNALQRKMDKSAIQFVAFTSPLYPSMLKTLSDPPLGLFIRGDYQDLPGVAIVGARRPSGYGLEMTRRLSTELAQSGMAIVSGMARGVDTAAHAGALSVGGKTVAVLACGADVVYPPENRYLMDRIAASGAIVSEYPPGTAPHKMQFPIRNRIISGLSLGTIVVEAAERSGSLITAQCAAEQGRDVFAVPGNVTSLNSVGPNRLIAEGARMVRSETDVLDELAWGAVSRVPVLHNPQGKRPDRRRSFPGNEAGRLVYEALCMEASFPDQLNQSLGLSPSAVQQTLLLLELEGLICRDMSGCFHTRM